MINLADFERQFSTDHDCKAFLAEKRWPDGVRCVRCGAREKVYALKARPFHWVCKNPGCGGPNGYRFSVITRTIFENTNIPLHLWFRVGYLMLTAKKGISSLQVRRVIFGQDSGSDWRTAWYMCHRWRAAMRGDAFRLTGIVEADETFVGGKEKNRHKNKRYGTRDHGGKVPVIGAIARKGNVVCKVIENLDTNTLSGFVRDTVSDKVSLVATDEAPGYQAISQPGWVLGRPALPHETVNHSAGEYVRGEVHTADIDSFWSLLKRGIMGSFHHVSKKYLPLYLNEFSYRHNNRDNPDVFGDLLTTCG
jgi:transposase-like protein